MNLPNAYKEEVTPTKLGDSENGHRQRKSKKVIEVVAESCSKTRISL